MEFSEVRRSFQMPPFESKRNNVDSTLNTKKFRNQLKWGGLLVLILKTARSFGRGEPRAGKNGQFLSLPGHVFILTDDGLLRILRANREKCDALRTYRVVEGDTWTAPALVGDLLFIKSGDHLSAWRFPSAKNEKPPVEK